MTGNEEKNIKENIPAASDSHAIAISNAIGEGAIITDDRIIEIRVGGDIQTKGVTEINAEEEQLPPISKEQAFERIGAAVRLNLSQLERNIEQARVESGQFFKLTLVFSSVGFIIVLVGVMLLFVGQITAGVVTSISSIIPEVTALLFFNKDKELRKTIEAYHQHMLSSQQILTMIDVAETIKDSTERDRMKQQIIYKVLNIDASAVFNQSRA